MTQGRPQKWVIATISEPISIGKAGIKIVIWDKWMKNRKGRVIISVGGISLYSYKAKKRKFMSWDKIEF